MEAIRALSVGRDSVRRVCPQLLFEKRISALSGRGVCQSDEPELESYQHLQQMLLLLKCLDWWWRDRQDFLALVIFSVYYSLDQRKSNADRLAAKLRELKTDPDSI